jgi:hypothetical protein
LDRLRAELARVTAERDEAREQLRLANIDQFNSEAEVADLKARLDTAWGDVASMQGIVDRLTAERDGARRSACIFKARYMDTRIGFSPMTEDEANAEARRIAARMRWDCFDEEEGA